MKKALIPAVLAAAVLLSGCVQPNNGTGGNGSIVQAVAAGDEVAVEYKGTFLDGTMFDSSEGSEPLHFTAGTGQMVEGFDNAVIGMEPNEEKTVTLQPSEAYGERDESRVVEIRKENIQNADELKAGMSLTSPSTGANGVIKEIKQDTIVVDFNHPLAGKTLRFWIKVVEIEKK